MEYIKDNIEWLFSGIGVYILGGVITVLLFIIKFIFSNKKSNGDGSIQTGNIKAGGDVKIEGGNRK